MTTPGTSTADHDAVKLNSASAEASSPRKTSRPGYPGKETMNGPLYMQSSEKLMFVRRVKRKDDGPTKQLVRWFLENQVGMSHIHLRSSRKPSRGGVCPSRQFGSAAPLVSTRFPLRRSL